MTFWEYFIFRPALFLRILITCGEYSFLIFSFSFCFQGDGAEIRGPIHADFRHDKEREKGRRAQGRGGGRAATSNLPKRVIGNVSWLWLNQGKNTHLLRVGFLFWFGCERESC